MVSAKETSCLSTGSQQGIPCAAGVSQVNLICAVSKAVSILNGLVKEEENSGSTAWDAWIDPLTESLWFAGFVHMDELVDMST